MLLLVIMKNFLDLLLDGFASIGRGMASMFDGSDLKDNPEIRRILETSTEEALINDWNAVIGDLQIVMGTTEKPREKL